MEALAHLDQILSGLRAMLQATLLDGQSLDPFTFAEDGLAAAEVDVGRGEIVEAFVAAAVVIVVDEGLNLNFQVT
jgi:hypothetical protein